MSLITVNPRHASPVPEAFSRGRPNRAGYSGHLMTFGFVDSAIRPLTGGQRPRRSGSYACSYGTDGAVVHAAIDLCEPGDVLVIDRGGDTHCACWGEMTSLAAKYKGISATIIDGAATDVAEILEIGYPVYARAISALTTSAKAQVGDVNVAIQWEYPSIRAIILADKTVLSCS